MSDAKFYNSIIPKLIQTSKTYTERLKKRIKIRALFSDFENKASNQFNDYVKESSNRYKEMKSGNSLGQYLSKSKEKYDNTVIKVLGDEFYTNFNLEEEKDIMKEKPSNTYLKKIKEITSAIKSRENPTNLYFADIESKVHNNLKRNLSSDSGESKTLSNKKSLDTNTNGEFKKPREKLEENKQLSMSLLNNLIYNLI